MQNVPSDSKRRSADCKFSILILQISAVAVILLAALIIRIVGGEFYANLSGIYHEKFDDITRVSEVLEPEKAAPSPKENEYDAKSVNAEPTYFAGGNLSAALSLDDGDADDIIENTVAGYVSDSDTSHTIANAVSANELIWPLSGVVTSEYGYRLHPVYGVYRMHGGIDIGANTGTPVCAAYDGTVLSAGYSDSYGYYIIISHSSSLKTLYAHCSKIIAKEGISVNKGDTVALVGSTGVSTGPHLHFEVRIGNSRVNPRRLLGEATIV